MTGYLFKLTSQQWLDESIYVIEHDGTVVWKHWVWLWVPTGKSIDPQMVRSAILLIEGGKNGGRPPNESDTYIQVGKFLSKITGFMFVQIEQIPNQKLIFKNDWKSGRTEDGLIALTWHHFLEYPVTEFTDYTRYYTRY